MSKRRAAANGTALDIRLKKFQPSKMQTNRACIMLGRKGTGKSTLIEDIMWYQQNIPCGCIMSATEEANENFARMAPPLFIYKDFDSEALQSLINRQKKMKKLLKRNNDYLPFDHRAFVILDDCMYNKKNFRGELMRELFMNGRHWDLFVLITIQYIMDMTTEIRTNTDYIFALKDNIVKNRERLFTEYFGNFPSFAVFDALFLEVTQDYRCLVLDNTKPSTQIEDTVFWYKAEKREPYRLGADWWWKYSAANVKTNEDAEEDKLLEEMNQKAVRVVMEGIQEQKPKKPPIEQTFNGPSRVKFSNNNNVQRNPRDMRQDYEPTQQAYSQYEPTNNPPSRYDERFMYDQRQYRDYFSEPRQVQRPQYDEDYYNGYRERGGYDNYPRQQERRPQYRADYYEGGGANDGLFESTVMKNKNIQPLRAGYNHERANVYGGFGGFV